MESTDNEYFEQYVSKPNLVNKHINRNLSDKKTDDDVYKLPDPSKEQQAIIKASRTNNIIVDAVAGSGKTTCILHIALEHRDKNTLLLTYNEKLKEETRKKAEMLRITWLEVHNYNSFGHKYAKPMVCRNDSELYEFLSSPRIHNIPKDKYKIIIIDEAQDMTPLYFELVQKILFRNNAQIVILGDVKQSIYQYAGANERYIVLADKVFNVNHLPWERLSLHVSYRITQGMADFLNSCILKDSSRTIRAKKVGEGKKDIEYHIGDIRGEKIFRTICDICKREKHEDIFILAASTKINPQGGGRGNSPVQVLINKLSTERNIPFYIKFDHLEKDDNRVTKDKVIVSSFHKVKGLERKVIIVLGFDEGYFLFNNKTDDRDTCPNILYVALTRASKKLVIIHHKENDYIPFLKLRDNKETEKQLHDFTTFYPDGINIVPPRPKRPDNLGVVDIIKYIPLLVKKNIHTLFKRKLITPRSKFIEIPIVVQQRNKSYTLYENVSDINGVAIIAYYEYLRTGFVESFIPVIREDLLNLKENQNEDRKIEILMSSHDKLWGKYHRTKPTIKDILCLSNKYLARRDGYKHRLKQINSYNWLKKEKLDECISFLNLCLKSTYFEVERKYVETKKEYELTGYVDCITTHIPDKNRSHKSVIVWEFKCVHELQDDHFIQLAIYAYLSYKQILADNVSQIQYRLVNVLREEIWEIEFNYSDLETMMQLIIEYRNGVKHQLNNDEFMSECSIIKQKIAEDFQKYTEKDLELLDKLIFESQSTTTSEILSQVGSDFNDL